MKVKTTFGTYDGCYLHLDHYVANNATAISIWSNTEGPIATLTVCLPAETCKKHESFVDVNNCPWAPQFIVEFGLGKATGEYAYSGFCEYPKYKFNMDVLKKYESGAE